jgi:hypothetical protein
MVKKGNGSFRKNLEKWIVRKGFATEPKEITSMAYAISRKINKIGTNLNRGKDKRFSGRNSGTISDFINEQNLNEFIKGISKNVTFEIAKLIKDD